MLKWVTCFRGREAGQAMAEYGLVLAVVVIGTYAVFHLLSAATADAIDAIVANLSS
jgi:Flp pilus assembly pilin Flp